LTYDEIDVALGAITRRNWVGLVNLIGDPDLLDYWRRKALQHGYPLPSLWNGETEPTDPRRSPRRSDTVDLSETNREVPGPSSGPSLSVPRGPSEAECDQARERERVFPENHCGNDGCRECNEEYGESCYE
jgi:hypothetical protein